MSLKQQSSQAQSQSKEPVDWLSVVKASLERQHVLTEGKFARFIVAYSGGLDSTALLYMMTRLRDQIPLDLVAAYYNHGWRGFPPPEIQRIHKNCERLKVPLVILPPDMRQPKNETIGRENRYRQLTYLASDLGADAVLTGHHANDQVETLLFRIFRGTGIDGLVGIYPSLILESPFGKPVPIVRPMLEIFRQDLQAYAELNDLRYYEDPTNKETHHQRNAIRHDILPAIESHFSQVKSSVLRLATLSQGDTHVLEDRVQELWEQLLVAEETPREQLLQKNSSRSVAVSPRLDVLSFSQLHRPYQRRIMRRLLASHGIEASFDLVESLLGFVLGASHRQDPTSGLRSLGLDEFGKPRFLYLYKGQMQVVSGPLASSSMDSSEKQAAKTSDEQQTTSVSKGELSQEQQNQSVQTFTALPGQCASPDGLQVMEIQELVAEDISSDLSLSETASWETYADLSVVLSVDKEGDAEQSTSEEREVSNFPQLQVRFRQPGDQIHPLGMPGPVRLKNFLLNRGVPRFERDLIPLLTLGHEVLWIPGVAISEKIKVQGTPTHFLTLHSTSPEPSPSVESAVEVSVVTHNNSMEARPV